MYQVHRNTIPYTITQDEKAMVCDHEDVLIQCFDLSHAHTHIHTHVYISKGFDTAHLASTSADIDMDKARF